MPQKRNKIVVPKDAKPGSIIRHEGDLLGVVMEMQEDGRAIINLVSQGTIANVPVEEGRECGSCESEQVYHDTKEEWMCPWCEDL